MARYSRRIGPPSDQILPVTFALVNGTVISRLWDDGELLIAYGALFAFNSGTGVQCFLQVWQDGAVIPGGAIGEFTQASAGTFVAGARTLIHPITAGPHEFKLMAQAAATPNAKIRSNEASLTIVELPLWDSDKDIL